MSRTCWLAEVSFETGVRSSYQPDPETVRKWLVDAIERSSGPIVHPSDVKVTSLIIQKPLPPPSPPPTKKRTLKRKAP